MYAYVCMCVNVNVIQEEDKVFIVHPRQLEAPRDVYRIEPDASAASYPFAAAAATGRRYIYLFILYVNVCM